MTISSSSSTSSALTTSSTISSSSSLSSPSSVAAATPALALTAYASGRDHQSITRANYDSFNGNDGTTSTTSIVIGKPFHLEEKPNSKHYVKFSSVSSNNDADVNKSSYLRTPSNGRNSFITKALTTTAPTAIPLPLPIPENQEQSSLVLDSVSFITKLPSSPQSPLRVEAPAVAAAEASAKSMPLGGKLLLPGKTHKYETLLAKSNVQRKNHETHKTITSNFNDTISSSTSSSSSTSTSTSSLTPETLALDKPRLLLGTSSESSLAASLVKSSASTPSSSSSTLPSIKGSLSSLAHFQNNGNNSESLKNFDKDLVSKSDDYYQSGQQPQQQQKHPPQQQFILEKEANLIKGFHPAEDSQKSLLKPENFQYHPASLTPSLPSSLPESPPPPPQQKSKKSSPSRTINAKNLKSSGASATSSNSPPPSAPAPPVTSKNHLNINIKNSYNSSLSSSNSSSTTLGNSTKINFDNYDNNSSSKYFSNGNHFICNGNGSTNGNVNGFLSTNTTTQYDDTNLRPTSTYILPSSSSLTLLSSSSSSASSSGGSSSSNSPPSTPSPSSISSRFLSTLTLLPNPSSGGSSNAFFGFCQCCNNLMTRCCFNMPLLKAINVRRCVLALFAITVVTILYYTHYVDSGVFVGLIHRDSKPPEPIINCRMMNGRNGRSASEAPDHRSEARLRIDAKVLVFVETAYSNLARDIAELLVYNRIKYKIEVAGKSLPVLTNLDKGRYGVVVFENFDKYLTMDKWNRELLDKYCREYSVGIVGFVNSGDERLVAAPLKDFPLHVHTRLHLRDASLNPASPVLRLTRAGETAWGALPGDDWAIFQHNHSTYEPIEWAQRNTQDYPSESDSSGQIQLPLTTILQDHGYIDGIQRVLFGSGLRFWLHRLVFLDALSYLSHGQLSLSLERMILVDIDDIFVGEKGTRLRPDDVRALVATQKIIASMVPGFRFNLGFSGKYYHHGTREENLGDDYLLQNVQEFNWFSHMWKHQQPHLYDNITLLMSEMQLNFGFAKEHNIPTDSGYSISPHHSGVYPAHEILYEAWKKVWNVRVTSTEEYPHLRPARLRRGFIHRNIMVLPRQTCGLFTHTMYIDRYPGGRDKLDESIQGGELFQTIVYNPINIFMTHMSNYGSDRLALYTFQSVIKFLQCWTNIKLASAPPIQLAEMYFKLHPEEVDPVWGNPCDDARHKKIWSKTKSCDSLPKFLVIGPQKTGTTALYTFLSMHPGIASNTPSADTFEEIQFFNGNNYYRGLDWYMDFFPTEPNTTTSTTPTHSFIFEKSATYFDGEMVPKRAHALLPHAKIVTILISPAKRAYSWYQHQRAHGDAIANNYSFYQVITASEFAPKPLKDLRNRCLNPGKYAQHLEHWLGYYPTQQLHIIDGEQLRSNPVDVMNDLQRFLKIQPIFDYTNHLRFDVKKGFFCIAVNEKRNKCLGKSKGRLYPTMDERSAKILQRYYLNHNTALVKLMKKLGSRPIPQWLKDDLSTGT